MQLSDPSSEGTATADMEEEDDIQEDGDEEELHRPRRTLRAAGGSSAQLSSRCVQCSGLGATASPGSCLRAAPLTMSPSPSRLIRSRASSPDGSGGGGIDYLRLTARQRARMDKEAGLAEDQQWHEIALPPELAYTWRGRGAHHVLYGLLHGRGPCFFLLCMNRRWPQCAAAPVTAAAAAAAAATSAPPPPPPPPQQ
jgi:hypothetical protein